MGNNLLSLTWMLVCVAVIIILAYLFTKYAVGRGGGFLGAGGGTERFRVLCRLSLGRDQAVALVQAGEKYLLLGVTPAGITVLAELTREEAEALYPRPDHQQQPPSFGEALRAVLKQKKPR